jgi:hypothetical protein
VPKCRPATKFSLRAGGQPSPHLVDLRAATANRPMGTPETKPAKNRLSFASVTVPRTVSHKQDQGSIWNAFALVAFGSFLFAIGKTIIIGLGKIVLLPLTIGFALVDRFDSDKPQPLTAEITNSPSTPLGAGKNQIPKKSQISNYKSQETPRAKRPFSLRRSLVSFAGVSLAVILPLQGLNAVRLLSQLKSQALTARSASLEAISGRASLSDAQEAIGQARQTVASLGEVGNALLERVPALGAQFRSGKALLEAGDNLSAAAALLAKSLSFVDDRSLDLTAKIAAAQELAERSEPLLNAASAALDKADELPSDMQENIDSLRARVIAAETLTSGFIAAAPSLRAALGEEQTRRYLVIFQNNAELRPTGGFIGSFALVDIDRGVIKKVEVPAGGSYDLQGSLKSVVLSPDPLRLISSKWEFQDANWFPDFPTSAKKISWFYQQSAGATVDGVIVLNAPLLAKLLDAVGPVSMPEYKTIATGTTVLATAQQIVESKEARESGKPKQFIADLMPRILEKITGASGDEAFSVLRIFSQALAEKSIQAYFSAPETQRAFAGLGWTGDLSAVPEGFDSLEVVRANIAGGKSDAVIHSDINHQCSIADDGRVSDRVTVTLSHNGRKGDAFTGVRNVTYLRLYVPAGSRLTAVSGDIRTPAPSFFDLPPVGATPDQTLAQISGPIHHDPTGSVAVNDEFGRTVFGVWTQTDPGASSAITFEYELPFTVSLAAPAPSLAERLSLAPPSTPRAAFGLLIGKQSGADDTEIRSSLKLPAGWYPSFAAPEGIAQTDGWSYTSSLASDRSIGIIVSK